jgi:hypothetical protein
MNQYIINGFYEELEKIAVNPQVTKIINRITHKYGPKGTTEAKNIIQEALRQKHAGKGFSNLFQKPTSTTIKPVIPSIKPVIPKRKNIRQIFTERLRKKEPIIGIPGKITI